MTCEYRWRNAVLVPYAASLICPPKAARFGGWLFPPIRHVLSLFQTVFQRLQSV
jgi:hypothetical protein